MASPLLKGTKTLVYDVDEDLYASALLHYTTAASMSAVQVANVKKDYLAYAEPLPGSFVITLVGCNTRQRAEALAQITAVFDWLTEEIVPTDTSSEGVDLNDFIGPFIRLNGSYKADAFGFKFSDNANKFLTINIIKQIHPKAGELIEAYCVEKDSWGKYTDGNGGNYTQLIKANAATCGYVPPPKAGTLLSRFCEGVDQWAFYTDGDGGKNPILVKPESEDCGFVPAPAAGALIDLFCVGTDQYGNFTDGTGGKRREIVKPKSEDCGYTGSDELQSTICVGKDKYGIYSDGNGGTKRELIEPNSPECGFTAPTNPGNGELVRKFCNGTTQMGEYTDGNGGTYQEAIAVNSPECGYVPPTEVPSGPTKTMSIYWQNKGAAGGTPNGPLLGLVDVTFNTGQGFVDVSGFQAIAGSRPPEGWSNPIIYGDILFFSNGLGRREGASVSQDRVLYPSSPTPDIRRFLASQVSAQIFNSSDTVMIWEYTERP